MIEEVSSLTNASSQGVARIG